MSPSLNKQTKYWRSQERRAKVCPYTWPFFEKKTSNKRHDVWYQCANDSPNRTVKWTGTDATFFSVKWKKSSEWFYPIRQLFHEFFQQLFQLDSHLSEVSQTPVSFSKLFFPIIATHWLKYEKKYYGPCENTHLYTWNCDFLHSPPANLLIYLFNEVAQIFYQYIARMCINMISLGGDKLKCPCF